MKRSAVVLPLLFMSLDAQQYTRGVGIYPGDPKEYFGPSLAIDSTSYRNLALHRPAWHSSAYDYNLTAQLVTDGIRASKLPRWIVTSTSRQGVLKKNEREWLLDQTWVTQVDFRGTTGWVQVEIAGDAPPELDRVDVDASVQARQPDNQQWTVRVSGSDDGKSWRVLGQDDGMARPTGDIKASVRFAGPSRSRIYRFEFFTGRVLTWRVGELAFFNRGKRVQIGGPHDFTSAWMPAGKGEEWVYVDLGAPCTFDRVALHWIRPAAEGAIQASNDAVTWSTVQALSAGVGDIRLPQTARGRYVRLLLTRPATAEGYILSEMEVYGRGGPVPAAKPQAPARADGRLDLAGGAWRLQRDSLIDVDPAALSQPGFEDTEWMIATVPGTVLTSYLNAGALPDPNYGDNQLMISDSFFHADFWYRDEFTAPASISGRKVWLNFGGINWKAEVYLNGQKLGRIEGGFTRGRFDVSSLIRPGEKNALAVRIEKNATPGSVKEKTFESPDKNGGAPGADNPTYHAAIGWDWIPTIRGRDTGIWSDVFLTATGPVTIEAPFITTALPLPGVTRADVTVRATLRNHSAAPVSGVLRGTFGSMSFQAPVTIDPSSAKTVTVDPLRIQNPKLWWPAGYGDPNLYRVELKFEANGAGVSDSTAFNAGIRQFAYSEEGGALRMWINGRRFIPRGGNWGFGESMLRYRAREYDAAIRYHAHMNFNMIRNWVGQIGDEAFYEACDRHGIVVWQDFWLANPWDGPDPDDNAMFLANVADTLLRIRNHASVGLYCGRNEGYPPKPIDDGIRRALANMHPGIHYISSSADDVVSGHGPYQALPVKTYFASRATPKFHSEMGMPNIVSMESLRAMMPESAMWPQGRMWGLHDFCLTGAQGGASFRAIIDKSYGGANNVADWVRMAQFVNYDGYRAMFEAQSKNRMGLLIWMSHPTWPSFVWQTYDYYLEPGAAYFGSRKGSEPLHIQWNQVTDAVEVVNYSGGKAGGLTARAQIFNIDGSVKWEKAARLDSAEDSVQSPFNMEYPAGLSPVHFLKLSLSGPGGAVSENFYWRGVEETNYRALRELPPVKIEAATTSRRDGPRWLLTTELRNPAKTPALLVQVKAVRDRSGDRILPVIYSDNFVSLMPGERRTIVTEVKHADTRGEVPRIVVQ